MIHVAVLVRELVSSNLDAIIRKATDPAKALGLLRSEIEETLISLHSELTMTRRQQQRTQSHSEKLAAEAETWTGKAKTAVDHGREDLARAALLARENGMADAAAVLDEANKLAKDVAELDAAIADLDAKRTDIMARAARLRAGSHADENATTTGRRDSTAARGLDRIDELERRLSFQTKTSVLGRGSALASAEAEIAALSQSSAIDAELKAMKAAPKNQWRKKAE